jgi:DNA-binding CsgD family transcriptional regulator
MQIDTHVPPQKSPPDWAALSHQERVVADLVSRGLTNQQIALRMFLSPHTINYHLRQIFRKLGIFSRVQLAGLAHTHLHNGQ